MSAYEEPIAGEQLGHCGILAADEGGKGIPGSLFPSLANSLTHSYLDWAVRGSGDGAMLKS